MSYYLNNQCSVSSFGKYDSKNIGASSIKSVASGFLQNKLNMDNQSQASFEKEELLAFNFEYLLENPMGFKNDRKFINIFNNEKPFLDLGKMQVQNNFFEQISIEQKSPKFQDINSILDFENPFPDQVIDFQNEKCESTNSILGNAIFEDSNIDVQPDTNFLQIQLDEPSIVIVQKENQEITVQTDSNMTVTKDLSNEINKVMKKNIDKKGLSYNKIVEILIKRFSQKKDAHESKNQNDGTEMSKKRKSPIVKDIEKYAQESQIISENIQKEIDEYDQIQQEARKIRNQIKKKNVHQDLRNKLDTFIKEIVTRLQSLRNRISARDSRLNKKMKIMEREDDFESMMSFMENVKGAYAQFLSTLPEIKRSVYQEKIFQEIDAQKSKLQILVQPKSLNKRELKGMRKNKKQSNQ